jgi:hypothetical protein
MLLVRFGFEGGIGLYWRLNSGSPPTFAIRDAEWELLNPLLYEQVSSGESAPFIEYGSGQFLGGTGEIVFLNRGKTKNEFTKTDETIVVGIALRLLTRLRHISGQAKAPQAKHLALITLEDIEEVPTYSPIQGSQFRPSNVSRYWFGVAITPDHIRTACVSEDTQPDIFETLFLDAIAAHMANEFRASILYAAMSMEVALGATFDEQYAKLIAGPNDSRFRVVRLALAGGQQVVKDPVFERLRESAHFPCKLHELSLYLLGRSLMVDNRALYLQARSLYTTRNNLVHSGVIEDSASANLYSLDQQGSFKALETVKNVLRWLGVDTEIQLPVFEFVPVAEMT